MTPVVQELIKDGYLKTPSIIEAFHSVFREDFLPTEMRDQADLNIPLPIRFGQTISQPLTVAFMLELLQPQKGDVILDVGAGSGWQTALLATLVGPNGKVVAIERIPQLTQFAEKNLLKYRFTNVHFVTGDGTKGYKEFAPYDHIIVAAAAKEIPHELQIQLKSPGSCVIPLGEWDQEMVLFTKDANGNTSMKRFPGFQFVSLTEGELPGKTS